MTDVPEKNVQETIECVRCGHEGDSHEISEETGKCYYDFDCDTRVAAERHRLEVNQRQHHDALRNHALSLPRVSPAKESPGSVKLSVFYDGPGILLTQEEAKKLALEITQACELSAKLKEITERFGI